MKSAGMRLETELTIVEAAYDAQYQSQQAFTCAFWQEYGYTPQIFRARKRFWPLRNRLGEETRISGERRRISGFIRKK